MRQCAPCPDSCLGRATGRAGQGARSARVAVPEAPLRRLSGSRSWAAGAGSPGCGGGRVCGGWRGPSAEDGVTGGDGRGAAKRGSQAYLGPRALAAPGDMMIDRVSPPAGMRSLSLFRPSACPARQGAARQRLRELTAVVPHLMRAAAASPGSGGVTVMVTGWHGPGSGGGERVVAEFGQDVAGLADELAGLRQGRRIPPSCRRRSVRCRAAPMHALLQTVLPVD